MWPHFTGRFIPNNALNIFELQQCLFNNRVGAGQTETHPRPSHSGRSSAAALKSPPLIISLYFCTSAGTKTVTSIVRTGVGAVSEAKLKPETTRKMNLRLRSRGFSRARWRLIALLG